MHISLQWRSRAVQAKDPLVSSFELGAPVPFSRKGLGHDGGAGPSCNLASWRVAVPRCHSPSGYRISAESAISGQFFTRADQPPEPNISELYAAHPTHWLNVGFGVETAYACRDSRRASGATL